jgi:NIMA-interacting peptidyl-prolyl cis-trans isomerase 1
MLQPMWRGLLVLGTLALFVGCGGSSESAKSPSGEEGKLSKGKQCLKDAAAPRELGPNAPNRIEVSHILVRHDGLKRPQGATRSPEEACLRALKALEALQGGAEWDEVVQKYSDAPGATMGNLGYVSQTDVDPKFADAAFSLEVNELSYVVETDRGFHIILRTD